MTAEALASFGSVNVLLSVVNLMMPSVCWSLDRSMTPPVVAVTCTESVPPQVPDPPRSVVTFDRLIVPPLAAEIVRAFVPLWST